MTQSMTQSIYTRWFGHMVGLLILTLMPVYAGAVDINRAGAQELAAELIQVGPAKAQAIVDYRKKNGAFRTIDDLRKVPGIGSRTLEMNRGKIKIQHADAPARANQQRAEQGVKQGAEQGDSRNARPQTRPQVNGMPSAQGKDAAGGH